MATQRGKTPLIAWGSETGGGGLSIGTGAMGAGPLGAGGSASLANTIRFDLWLDRSNSFHTPRVAGSPMAWKRDSWVTSWERNADSLLVGEVRRIPIVDTVVGTRTVTGWNGSSGWMKFLEWAREGNIFRWAPEEAAYNADNAATYQECYLVEPHKGGAEPDAPNGRRRLKFAIRSSTDGLHHFSI